MRSLHIFKKINIFFILLILILIFYLIDFAKINFRYVNKNLIEFNYENLDQEFNKRIYFFFEKYIYKNFFSLMNKSIDYEDNFYELQFGLKDKKIIKSEPSTINNKQYKRLLGNWYRSHGNNYSNRFSNLEKINSNNIDQLEIAWIYRSDKNKNYDIDIQCNPIVVNGVIYTPVAGGYIAAIDGYTGKELWKSEKFNNDVARRGILFSDKNKYNVSRLYFNNGSKLIALDSSNGKRDFSFGKDGAIKTGYSKIAPLIFKNNLIVASWKKDLEIYNLDDGKLEWKYYFGDKKKKIINQPEYNNSTGGNPWSGISLDEDRGIVFITTGNPSNYFDGTKRPGVNYNSNSLIAISLHEKRELWSFQETIHDIWNLDLPAPPILTSVNKDNKKYDVVLTVTKRGNTLILDRLTGKPFFDLNFNLAPKSKVANEFTSPIQLDIKIPEPFSKNIFKLEDLKNLELFDEITQKKLQNAKFGFFATPELNKDLIMYNFHGGAEWMGASVDHDNQILYVNSNEIAWITRLEKNINGNLVSKFSRIKDKDNLPGTRPPWGKITAINLKNGKIIWSVPFGNYKSFDMKIDTGTENFGGITATSGKLIFATGTLDSKFYVYNSENGNLLYEIELPFIGSAPPTTYLANNEQFVIVQSTGSYSLEQGYPEINNFGDAIVAFNLKK